MNVDLRVKRADALYFAIAITVTIIELAIIATSPHLGAFALEYALITQLALSILVEFGTAYILVTRFGVIRATHAGFIFKAMSCCLFFAGVAVSSDSFIYGWSLIIMSFLFDSMGTGLLKAAFRPAYSALHYSMMGRPADFVDSLIGFGAIRLGLPCLLLFLVGAAHLYATPQEVFYVMFILVFGCRCFQVLLARGDLRTLILAPTQISDSVKSGAVSLLKAFKKVPGLWVCYTVGTVFESVILMYGIGLIYKYKAIALLPDTVTWMGASAASLWIYLISYAGAGYVIRYWCLLKNSNVFLVACACMTGTVVYLLMLTPGEAGYFAGLLGFCFLASLSALLLVRHASTQILLIFNERDSAKIFVWTELAANLALIVVVGTATTLVGPESILRIFGIFFGLSTAVAIVLCIKGHVQVAKARSTKPVVSYKKCDDYE
ncbi:hypothetical protein KDX30_16145 [Pseudomonas sp. CDFA 553]|uniref:hypothetical protein n=1 Tax=Pseudomonas quasicaspiana TaxID=2829821 RepID=UPI001E3DE3A1|nr:hypothetical protein [Pseudomonas quasicaspiana]MCD5989422.1 hypothetical protein [Pseudomonas quasicaspiana]